MSDSKSNETLSIRSTLGVSPVERILWRSIGCMLNLPVEFADSEFRNQHSDDLQTVVSLGERQIRIQRLFYSCDRSMQEIAHDGQSFRLWSESPLRIKSHKNGIDVSDDIVTPLVEFMISATPMPNGGFTAGPRLGTSSEYRIMHPTAAHPMADYVREIAGLISTALHCPLAAVRADVPYSLGILIDVQNPDCLEALAAQLESFQLRDCSIALPTCSELPAPLPEKAELFLLDSTAVSIDKQSLLRAKQQLEEAAGRTVVGYRHQSGNFVIPDTWMWAMRAGFEIDASLMFPSHPGSPIGSYAPMFLPDPDGFTGLIGVIPISLSNLHLSGDNTELDSRAIGKDGLDQFMDNFVKRSDYLVVHWQISDFGDLQREKLEPLKQIIARAVKDGAFVGGLNELVTPVRPQWTEMMEQTHHAIRKSDASVRSHIPRYEVDSYIKTFREASRGAHSIDAATSSLLDVLPNEVETIVDVGCGPGNVTNGFPEFRRVLAMDLDTNILKSVSKPTRLGNITSIPLDDKSTDMAVSCDVLEHLGETDLARAIAEITRVTRRYIYLQTPYNEVLSAGNLECPHCGYFWHINHHKQSFTTQRLLSLLPEPWRPVSVNFTGEINLSPRPRLYYNFAEMFGNSEAPAGPCPLCDGTACATIRELDAMASRSLFFGSDELRYTMYPAYSEIGVLYEYGGDPLEDRDLAIMGNGTRLMARHESVNYHAPPSTEIWRERSMYSPFHKVPHLVASHAAIIPSADGVQCYAAQNSQPSVLFAFPRRSTGADGGLVLKVTGHTSTPTSLGFLTYESKGTEVCLDVQKVSGTFEAAVEVPPHLRHLPILLRLAWSGGSDVTFTHVGLHDPPCAIGSNYHIYHYDPEYRFPHFEIAANGMLVRGLLPYGGKAYFATEIEDWVNHAFGGLELRDNLVHSATSSSRETAATGLADQGLSDYVSALESMVVRRYHPPQSSFQWRLLSRLASHARQVPVLASLAQRVGAAAWYRRKRSEMTGRTVQ